MEEAAERQRIEEENKNKCFWRTGWFWENKGIYCDTGEFICVEGWFGFNVHECVKEEDAPSWKNVYSTWKGTCGQFLKDKCLDTNPAPDTTSAAPEKEPKLSADDLFK